MHGSGTTNPPKCVWMHIQSLMDMTKVPVILTYNAVGSSTCQSKLLGMNDTATILALPYNNLGSGDLPLSTLKYYALEEEGIYMVHLPYVLGTVSLFHKIPNVTDGICIV